MTTYKTMDISDLGDNATETDLTEFRLACEARQRRTGETDEQVTAALWGDGNWSDPTEAEIREALDFGRTVDQHLR